MNDYEPCLINEIDCIRRFITIFATCNCTFLLNWLERKIKINDTLQLLLGRHIFDIKFS